MIFVNKENSNKTTKGSGDCLNTIDTFTYLPEPLPFLKIPEFLIKHAKKEKINISSIQAWYILKSITKHGLFSRKKAILALEKYFSATTSTKLFNGLITLDMLALERRCKKKKYRLVSYNKFFTLLGYDLSPKRTKKGRFLRKGEFRILKIKTSELLQDFRNVVTKYDLNLYVKRKVYSSLKRINRANTERQLILKYVGKPSNKQVSEANLIRVFNSKRIITDICRKFYDNPYMLNSLFNCIPTITNKRMESEIGVKRSDLKPFIDNLKVTSQRAIFVRQEAGLHMDNEGYLPNQCSGVKGGIIVKVPKMINYN